MTTTSDTRSAEPPAPAAPGQVSFLEIGSVAPTKVSPLIESLKDAHSVAGEELRLLRAKVRKATEGDRRCIGITSALPGEGKSTLSAGLAAALARDAGRRVLLDVAPILPVADTILMQDLVDGFLLVVRSRQTPRDAILEALGRLREDKIMGLVLNDHSEYARSYTSYAYERYGMTSEARRGGRRPR